MKEVELVFVHKDAPERLRAEVEIHFNAGPLEGMKLVGASVWEGADGELYVTFPSRAFGAGNDRRYFDYLRPVNADWANKPKGVKAWIRDEYKEWAENGGGCTCGEAYGKRPSDRPKCAYCLPA